MLLIWVSFVFLYNAVDLWLFVILMGKFDVNWIVVLVN